MRRISPVLFMVFLALGTPAEAADFVAEVMTLKGSATVVSAGSADSRDLKEGDVLREGDRIEVGPASHADIAYDREWNNLTRLGENSKTTIESIFPTGLQLDRGVLFAKLGKMPKGTTFEVHTPTAVAAARGTEFLVAVDDKGATDVVGIENKVEVFNLDAQGNLGERVVLEPSQQTEIPEVGSAPAPPEKADMTEFKMAETMSVEMEKTAATFESEGRFANVQTVGTVEVLDKMTDAYMGTYPSGAMPPPSDTTAKLSETQMAELREQFVEMGGDPAQFDVYKDKFSTLDTDRFKTVSGTYDGGTFMPPPDSAYPHPSTTGDGSGTMAPPPAGTENTDRTYNTTTFSGSTEPVMPPLGGSEPKEPMGTYEPTFRPPDMQHIESSVNQTTQQITQQIDQTTTHLPPPPMPDCMADPSKCTTTTTGGG